MSWDQKKWYREVGKFKAAARYKASREDYLEKARVYRADPEKKRKMQYQVAKSRAKDQGVPFSIRFEDIAWVDTCPLLEIELTYEGDKWSSPSLDRIIPALGYVPGNVRVISTLANTMKAHATKEQLGLFAKNILEYLDK